MDRPLPTAHSNRDSREAVYLKDPRGFWHSVLAAPWGWETVNAKDLAFLSFGGMT
ncbi:MAG: hypothetical protein ACYSYM_05720 [Planctomycetota bacterium]|jgi:hypothetical protein